MPTQQTKPVLFVYPEWDRDARRVMAHVLTHDNEEGIDFDPYPGELPPERGAAKLVLEPLQEAWHKWWRANRSRYSAVVCFGGEAHDLVLGKGSKPASRRGYPQLLGGVWAIPTLDPRTVGTTGSGADEILFDLRLLQRVWSGEPLYESIPEDRLRVIDPDPQLRANRRKRLGDRVWMEEMYHRIERAQDEWNDSQGPFAVAVDIETEGLDFWARRLWSAGFCWCEEEAWAVNWDQLRHREEERQWLRGILHDFPIIMHNGQFDAPFLAHHLGCKTTSIKYDWDTELLSYLLDERADIHGLKRLATDRFRAPAYGQDFGSGRSRKAPSWQDAWAVIDHMIEFELRTGLGRDATEWGAELAVAQGGLARKLIPDECNPPRSDPADGPLVWSTGGVAIAEETWRRYVGADGEPLGEKNGGVYCDVQQERQDLLRYNATDCWYTWRLLAPLLKAVEEDEQLPVYKHILRPAGRHFARLRLEGVQVDLAELRKAARGWCDRLEYLEGKLLAGERIDEAAGRGGFNLNSTQQVSRYLFQVLGLRKMHAARPDGKLELGEILEEIRGIEDEDAQEFWRAQSSQVTKGLKQESVSLYMLHWLAQQHQWPRWLCEYRVLLKRFTGYAQGVWIRLDQSNRLHPSYRLGGTRTGRFSSTDLNIHGTPRDPEIKRMFVADPGYTLVAADYSQAEIRMLAHLARDEDLTQVLREGDIHTRISCELYGVTLEELQAMDDEQRKHRRRAAKTIAFGIIYGRTAQGLAPQLGVTVEEAEGFIRRFEAMMPAGARWIARQKETAVRELESRSLYGRKRRFPVWSWKLKSRQFRQAVNMPVQSSVSDMTVLANLRVVRVLRRAKIGHRVWPHIHDGFLIQVKDEDVERAWRLVAATMADPGFETDVPFTAEIATGKSWGDCKVVWDGLKPDGIGDEDGAILARYGRAPDFPYFAKDVGGPQGE